MLPLPMTATRDIFDLTRTAAPRRHAGAHARAGDPPGPLRRAHQRVPARSRAGAGAGARRRARLRHGRGHQLQQRLGRARRARRRHQGCTSRPRTAATSRLPHRRQRRLGHRLRGRLARSRTSRSATRSSCTAACGMSTTPSRQAGNDPMFSTSFRIWGYETQLGQLRAVHQRAGAPVPAQAAAPHAGRRPPPTCSSARPPTACSSAGRRTPSSQDDVVLIWGGSGGLGSMAIQIAKALGGIPVAVVSSDDAASSA